jgi:hypothetical protein
VLWKWYRADKTNRDDHKLNAALDHLVMDGLSLRKNMLEDTLTQKRKLPHIDKYFIAPMLLLLLVIIAKCRRQQGTNLGLQAFPD